MAAAVSEAVMMVEFVEPGLSVAGLSAVDREMVVFPATSAGRASTETAAVDPGLAASLSASAAAAGSTLWPGPSSSCPYPAAVVPGVSDHNQVSVLLGVAAPLWRVMLAASRAPGFALGSSLASRPAGSLMAIRGSYPKRVSSEG